MNFTPLDWSILVIYLAATIAAGIWVKRYVEDLSGYIVAGRRVRVHLGIATFAATEMGIITFMYFGELGYVSGFAPFVIGILAMVAYSMVGKTGFVIEALRRFRVMTIPEFYELRYNRKVRLVGGVILFVGGVLNMGIFLKFDGIFLREVMGFGPETLAFIMTFMLVVVISYTVLGGMFSVVITDFMQFVILSFSMLVATVAVLLEVSPAAIGAAVRTELGDAGFSAVQNPIFGWTFLIWILVTNVAAAALWQPGASRALAAQSPSTAKKIFFFTGLTFAGRAMIPMFWGVAALAYFGPGLDGAEAMPRLLGQVVPMGFLGLLVAGMLAASMSTYSSYLLAWSSVFTLDVVSSLTRRELSERAKIWITRGMACTIGVFLLFFGLWYQLPETAFQYLFLTGTMYTAGALGCVTAGIYWSKANSVGAFTSLILGAAAPAAFLILEGARDQLPHWLAFLTNVNVAGMLSFVLAAGGMIVGSLLTQHSHPPRRVTALQEV